MSAEELTLYCLHKTEPDIEALAKQFSLEGHNVRHFSSPDSLLVAIEQRYPQFILVTPAFFSRFTDIGNKISDINARQVEQIKLVIFGLNGNLDEKLSAKRLNCDLYIPPPHQVDSDLQALTQENHPDIHNEHVLVVAQDNTQAEYAVNALQSVGYKIKTCSIPAQVTDVIRKTQPDLILADQNLGDITGEELAWMLHNTPDIKRCPFILRMQEYNENERARLLNQGVDDLVHKPTSPELLRQIVQGRIARFASSAPSTSNTPPILPKDTFNDYPQAENDSELESSHKKEVAKELAEDLVHALSENNLSLEYQPVINLSQRDKPAYDVQLIIRGKDGRSISYRERRRIGSYKEINLSIDRWLLGQATQQLHTLQVASLDGLVLLQTTAQMPTLDNLVTLVSENLLQHRANGKGLVLIFRLSDIAADIRQSQTNIRGLQTLGVKVAISDFVDKSTAFNMLKFVNADLVIPAKHLANLGELAIADMVKRSNKLSVKTLIRHIDSIGSVNLNWVKYADYAQGNLIQPSLTKMEFNFSDAVI